MQIKFNSQICEVRKCGKKYSKNFNNEGEGGGWRFKYGLFNEKGEKIGAVVPGFLNNARVMKDGKTIGSIRFNPDSIE